MSRTAITALLSTAALLCLLSPGAALDFESPRLAIQDLTDTFGAEYPNGHGYRARLAAFERRE